MATESNEKAAELTAAQEIKQGIAKLETALRKSKEAGTDEEQSEVFEVLLDTINSLNSIFNSGLEGSDAVFTPQERRSKLGTGIKSFGFSQAACNSAIANPLLLPACLPLSKFGKDVETATLLQQVYNSLHQLDISLSDTLMLYADHAYRDALEYYNSVKTAAKQKIPGAEVEYNLLKAYFKKSKSSQSGEPTEEQIERDVRSLFRGTKDGKIVIENERPTVSAGKRRVTDDIYSGRSAVRETKVND